MERIIRILLPYGLTIGNLFRTSYKTDDAFNFVYLCGKGPNFGTVNAVIWIFREISDGKLERYITMISEWWTDYVYNEQYQ
ncbi:hypothetical protein [Bacillus pretiosus]|uniref:hypothetical protein n=1 Tax=Bacillus pretiosus TaxID=2983392 RepID=UPI003D64DD9F